MGIGERIQYYLDLNDMQQKELAEKIRINPVVLNRIIKNHRPIRGDELSAIAKVFRVSTDYLLGKEDSPMESMKSILLAPSDCKPNPTKEMLDDYSSLSAKGKEKARSFIKYLVSEDKEAQIKKDYGKSTTA